MGVLELKQAHDRLSENEQLLLARFIAADQMLRDPEFAETLARRHRAMNEGKKWSHEDALSLHRELADRGL